MKQGNSGSGTSAATVEMELPVTPRPAVAAELDQQLDRATEDLFELRRRQEELERQRSELEEIRRWQDEYLRGRAEILDCLTRGLVTLEREQIAAQRLAEMCQQTAATFREYKERLEAIRDQEWTSGTVRRELSQALAIIQDARGEYNRARTKLDCLNPATEASAVATESAESKPVVEPREVMRYAILGAVASASVVLMMAVALVVWWLGR
ncbi:MAG: hypothetical protein NZ483_04385 [Verrucomicrobiae bacterium]|nr:hypothetical protein [Verrucomicrobiae bacterium]MDW8343076.1 hypothetical protein [Verrucomicrobiae bacterium]